MYDYSVSSTVTSVYYSLDTHRAFSAAFSGSGGSRRVLHEGARNAFVPQNANDRRQLVEPADRLDLGAGAILHRKKNDNNK